MTEAKIRAKFSALAKSLGDQLVDRGAIIEGMICAALAGEHVLLLGPPGTAKSALANAFTSSVDGARCFSWLLTRYTVPEEIFGPMSFSGIKKDRYCRVTAGKLPESEVAFLDEVFKANSAILNALLSAVNERVFHNDGGVQKIPLRMVVGASNELPEGPELAAFYDRFLLRYWVDYVSSPASFLAVMLGGEPKGGHALNLEEWDTARELAQVVKFGEEMGQQLYRLRAALEKESVRVSDRRWKRCVRLLKAHAWLSESSEVEAEHFSVLADALWDNPEQATVVAEQVQKVAVSTTGEVDQIVEMIRIKAEEFKAYDQSKAPSDDEQQALIVFNREARRARAKIEALINKAKNDREKAKLEDRKVKFAGVVKPLQARARDLFEI